MSLSLDKFLFLPKELLLEFKRIVFILIPDLVENILLDVNKLLIGPPLQFFKEKKRGDYSESF